MTLPISSYEKLLDQVRELTHETILLQRNLNSVLYNAKVPQDVNHNFAYDGQSHINERILTDHIIRKHVKSRETDDGQGPAVEYKYRPRFATNLETTDYFRAGNLTSRLLAQGSRDQMILQEDTEITETGTRGLLPEENHRLISGRDPCERFVEGDSSGDGGGAGVGRGGRGGRGNGGTSRPRFRHQRHRDGGGRSTSLASYLAHAQDGTVASASSAFDVVRPVATVAVAPVTTSRTGTAVAAATAAAAAAVRCAAVKGVVDVTDVNTRPYLLNPSHKETVKEDAMEPEIKEEDERRVSTSSPEFYVERSKCYNEDGSSEEDNKLDSSLPCHGLPSSYSGTWPIRRDLWTNQQMGYFNQQSTSTAMQNDTASVMSFSSNSGTMLGCSVESQGHRRLGAKVGVVYNLLSMLGSTEGREDMSATLLSMSTSIDSCLVMRQSGCLPLLVQLIHAPGQDPQTRERASRALHNVVHAKSDERTGRREARVLRFLEQLRDYCQSLRAALESGQTTDLDLDKHPGQTLAALMKLSFDEAHRHAMCQLGGLHAVAELIEMDHLAHGSECDNQNCITLRRYAGMALTNLTFGDGNNKALLCSFREFMKALVSQLRSPSDDLRQVTASVLRNLSWRADSSSKQTLREVGAVTGLMKAAMEGRKESTLKSILSALWNLSAHCSTNKVDICAVDGALAFLVDMLSYNAPSKTLAIVENAGGILRNVSSHIAAREDYRAIVRERGCLQVLLQQLRSPSLTVVSNACGVLWNLSARCPQDQRLLWSLGAVPMLRSLIHSKHKMISMGSSATLKNLLSARPECSNLVHLDSTARGLGLTTLPTLVARRQRALEQEIDQNLAETCDNIEPSTSPTNKDDKFTFKVDHNFLAFNTRGLRSYQLYNQPNTSSAKCNGVSRSESRESMRSVTSTHSDTMFERVHRHVLNGISPTEIQAKQQSLSLHSTTGFDNGASTDQANSKASSSEKKYTLRYKNAIPESFRPNDLPFAKIADLSSNNSTLSWSSVPDQEAVCSQTLLHSSVEDNSSLINQSTSSATKFNDQSSESEETEIVIQKSKTNFSSKQREEYESVYTDKSLLHRDPLNTIKNAISPTLSHDADSSLFRNYTETDLDQPTDYSIRYAEHTLEDDEKQHAAYFTGSEPGLVQEDTLKMYCTEDTPGGTSLNSSRAASTSDLQEDSRVKLSKKLLEPTKLQDTDDVVQKISSKNYCNSSDLQVIDNDFVEANCEQESNFTKTRSSMIPAQMSSDIPQYNKDNSKKSNVVVDVEKHEILQNRITNNSKLSKGLFPSKVASCVGNLDQTSDVDEDEEDLLAACINIGMQNNRHRHSFIGNKKVPREESNLIRYHTSIALNQVESTDSSVSTTFLNTEQLESTGSNLSVTIIQEELSNKRKVHPNNLQTMEHKETKSEVSVNETRDNMKHTSGDNALNTDNESSNRLHSSVVSDDICMNDTRQIETMQWKEETVSDNEMETSYIATEFAKITDSESSNSIDSVEQSEHALLKLCIQPTTVDSANRISEKQQNLKTSTNQYQDNSNQIPDQKCDSDTVDAGKTDDKSFKRTEEDVYRRQRDPDAMIASLDRLTATLVQQTEAMREKELNSLKQSVLSDAWNEDSPNDVSFPTISISAPIISSFKSDIQDGQVSSTSDTVEVESDGRMNMTNSKIIQQEAIKLAAAVDAEVHKQNEIETTSMTSIDLDMIKPPSTMGSLISLTTSYVGPADSTEIFIDGDRCSNSTSLPPVQTSKSQTMFDSRNNRKKSLPLGVVAKRALGHGQNHTNSLENLLNDCTSSHLENVKPPSIMDELFDVGDMENSMLSVASITSEVVDPKDQDSHSLSGSDPVFDLLRPVANVLSITCMKYAEGMQSSGNNSLSECLENINPPSLFNEVNEMDQSTIEGTTECSDTLCIDTEFHTEEVLQSTLVEAIDEAENDTDEGATTLSSEYCVSSSAESTPRKRLNKDHLTPKQKRNLAKERYKTYTIAAEFVKKEEVKRKQENSSGNTSEKVFQGKCSPFSKLTPKQRRQEDRARFQTQVLENPFPTITSQNNKPANESTNIQENMTNGDAMSVNKSGIPTLTKLHVPKILRKKRTEDQENKERYRTRTLNESICINKNDEDETATSKIAASKVKEIDSNTQDIESEELKTLLEQNSTVLLKGSNELNKAYNSIGEDILLEQETLSLVSNESGSEQSLRLRFVSGVSKKLMDMYKQETDLSPKSDQIAQEDREELETERLSEDFDAMESGSDNGSNCTEDQYQITKRPRIIKPGMESNRDVSGDSNVTDKSEPGSPKAIRGRRKALYSNPITRKSTPQSSPLKQPTPISAIPIGRSNTSPIVRTTKATTLRQSNSPSATTIKDTGKSNSSPRIPTISNTECKVKNMNTGTKKMSTLNKTSTMTFTKFNKRHSTPVASSSNISTETKVEGPTKTLERQGTFTKDEPEVENAPTVVSSASPVKTKIAKPVRNTSKVHPAVGKPKVSTKMHHYQAYQPKSTKTNNTEKSQLPKNIPLSKKTGKSIATEKTSTSNQGTQQSESGKVIRKVEPLGQRSNSNSSIISETSISAQNRKAAKEATSKIASLWKKVEESKSKQLSDNKSDTRKWIAPSNNTTEVEIPPVTNKKPAFRLFRSSTFEGVPQDESHKLSMQKLKFKQPLVTTVQSNVVKYRNSCDLSGMSANEAPCKIPIKLPNITLTKKDALQTEDNLVVLRRQKSGDGASETDNTKRISRLGSFITVDPPNTEVTQIPVLCNGRTPASAIVPPFNYNPKSDIPSQVTKVRSDDTENKFDVTDCHVEVVTASARVTTV